MSSPIRNTDSSRRISSAIPSRSTSPIVSRRAGASGVDIAREGGRVRVSRGAGEGDRGVELRLDLRVDRVGRRGREPRAGEGERVALAPPRLLLARAVGAGVAAAVADEAVRLALEQRRAATGAR